MSWNDVAIKAAIALIPILAALLALAVGYLANYLKKLSEKVGNDTARKSLLDAVTMAESKAVDAIAATKQLLVDDLKAAHADGKLEDHEIKRVMEHAIEYWRGHIGADFLAVLEAAYGPWQEWLEGYLEAKLGLMKWGEEAYGLTIPPSSPGEG